MSLISRLLHGATGAPNSNTKPLLDSKVDTQYSYNLLFPDPESLGGNDKQLFPLANETAPIPAAFDLYDVNADLDLEAKDVRVIIMQEAAFSATPYLLYDSHPAPPVTPTVDRAFTINVPQQPTREARRSISSPRKGSLGQTSRPVIIQDPSPSAFGRRPVHHRSPSLAESDSQKHQREYKEEIHIFSQCIFGSSEISSYKGTGTKLHILPSENKQTFVSGSYAADGSFGRSSLRAGSKLSQSFTSGDVSSPTSAGFSISSIPTGHRERKRVLITRMFPVQLPTQEYEEIVQDRTPTGQSRPASETAGYPFPVVDQPSSLETKKIQPKQKKTPMYAVGVVITLPPSPPAQVHTSRSSMRAPGSYTEPDSIASSFNSTRRAGWTMLGNEFGVESVHSAFSSEVEDKVDIVTQNWDIIMRALSHLQTISTSVLLPLLKQADISSPDPRRESFTHSRKASASVSIAGKRVADEPKLIKPPKTNAKSVSLTANCLASNHKIQTEVVAARERIVGGLKATRVVTSQGRWGIWREEARLVNKWSGGREEGFFFFNLLTGFLGNHTEWLQHLGPYAYRRRHYQQQRGNKDDDISLPARTIVVADNKIMARRLIFLLAAFLPATQPLTHARIHRPSTSTSFGGYSQSPPGAYTLREESLRRRLNKQSNTGNKLSHNRTLSFPSAPPGRAPLEIHHHQRRPSDAQSIKTANLPIPGSDLGSRKSSAVTTSTGTSITTMPHFSTRRPARGTGPLLRPGSSGSIATDDLKRSLKRDSSSHYSNISNDSGGPNSRWGSMISGFWSSKRRDSSASTSVEPLTIEGLEIKDNHREDGLHKKCGKLEDMVSEVTLTPAQAIANQEERATRRSDGSAVTAKQQEDENAPPSRSIEPQDPPHDPNSAYQSPVKTSINVHDGVIEIDVPIPDFLAFDTAVSSPSSSGYMSTPGLGNGLEGFEHYSHAGPESDTTLNVGGWLQQYHPDFALHAIPSTAATHIVDEVKESMRSEPTPVLPLGTPQGATEKWVDISSAVIADTTNFIIKHILYRRLVRFKEPSRINQAPSSLPDSFNSRYGDVYASALLTPGADILDGCVDEKFIEEPIISLDETLVDAIEKIIAQSDQVTAEASASSSRAPSPNRRDQSGSQADGRSSRGTSIRASSKTRAKATTSHPTTHLEVPRNECKRMILGALEDIVREVVEGRKEGALLGGGSAIDGARERGLERGESFLREGVRLWLEGVEAGG